MCLPALSTSFWGTKACLRVYVSAGHVCPKSSHGVPHTCTLRPTSAASDGNNWDLPRLFVSLKSACRRASASCCAFACRPFHCYLCIFHPGRMVSWRQSLLFLGPLQCRSSPFPTPASRSWRGSGWSFGQGDEEREKDE